MQDARQFWLPGILSFPTYINLSYSLLLFDSFSFKLQTKTHIYPINHHLAQLRSLQRLSCTENLYQHKLLTWGPLSPPNRTNSAKLLCTRGARLRALLSEHHTMATATALVIPLRRRWTVLASLLRRTVCYTYKTAVFQIF